MIPGQLRAHVGASILVVAAIALNTTTTTVATAETAAAGAAAGGEGEPPIRDNGAAGAYLRAMHARVHAQWSGNFLQMAAAQLPRGHALNVPTLRVVLEASVTRAGTIAGVRVKEPSGTPDFDRAALEVLRESGPMPPAPDEGLSDDDRVHLTWAFARDHRRCSGVELVHKEGPFEEALPRLVAAGREGEALRRVGARAAAVGDVEGPLSRFATLWLARVRDDRQLARAAAVGLLATGDHAGQKLATEAILRDDLGPEAAIALARAKIALCPLVGAALGKAGSREQRAALAGLRAAPDSTCLTEVIAVARDRTLPPAPRVAALEIMGPLTDPAARKALVDLEKDSLPAVRAAALLARAQPGGGRAALFRLTPLLRDPSVEVRAAAIAGLLRSNGDASLDQLYMLWKETDPRPYEAAAAGLARLASEGSAQMLRRIHQKNDRRLRLAAAAALAARSDPFARAALEAVKEDPAPEVRVFAGALLSPAERRSAVQAAAAAAQGSPGLYPALLAGAGRAAAADWLLERFPGAAAPDKAMMLVTWLTTAPPPASPPAASNQ